MKRTFGFFLAGLILGELDPIGWGAWQVLERRLPSIREDSLAAPSPFEQIPSSAWLAESEHAYAIEDTHAPTAPVHLLIVPKQRHATLLEPETEVLGEMLELARRVARQKGIAESGFRITINTNPHGGQTVYHLHMHMRGGRQLREPLLPFIWGRLSRL